MSSADLFEPIDTPKMKVCDAWPGCGCGTQGGPHECEQQQPAGEAEAPAVEAECSRVVRVKYRGAETSTTLLTADNMSVREAPDGGVVVELFRYGADGKAIEGFQFHFCALDRERMRGKV